MSCKKVSYETRHVAVLAAHLLGTRAGNVPFMRAYMCPRCNKFHLTHLTELQYSLANELEYVASYTYPDDVPEQEMSNYLGLSDLNLPVNPDISKRIDAEKKAEDLRIVLKDSRELGDKARQSYMNARCQSVVLQEMVIALRLEWIAVENVVLANRAAYWEAMDEVRTLTTVN
jgi:hypothetical protein